MLKDKFLLYSTVDTSNNGSCRRRDAGRLARPGKLYGVLLGQTADTVVPMIHKLS